MIDDGTDEFFDEILDFLENFEGDEDTGVIRDFDWFLSTQTQDDEDEVEAESPDAIFWREIAEDYEYENMLHQRFQNLLMIQLMSSGSLGALGAKGIWN